MIFNERPLFAFDAPEPYRRLRIESGLTCEESGIEKSIRDFLRATEGQIGNNRWGMLNDLARKTTESFNGVRQRASHDGGLLKAILEINFIVVHLPSTSPIDSPTYTPPTTSCANRARRLYASPANNSMVPLTNNSCVPFAIAF